jgi:hypothetical protein
VLDVASGLFGAQAPYKNAAGRHLDERVEGERDEDGRLRRDAGADPDEGLDGHPADRQVFEAKRAPEELLAISSKHRR